MTVLSLLYLPLRLSPSETLGGTSIITHYDVEKDTENSSKYEVGVFSRAFFCDHLLNLRDRADFCCCQKLLSCLQMKLSAAESVSCPRQKKHSSVL